MQAQTAEPAPRSERILADRYWLGRLLGVGATASVFEAVDMKKNRRVAVKRLHRELADNAALREQFLSEAVIANRIHHSGVVRILDVSDGEADPAFLVMELLRGETLEQRCSPLALRMDACEVGAISYEVLDVLSAAHDQGVFHCDIKPSNLFLTNDAAVKLLDFGAARLVDAEDSAAIPTPVGTPGFMPPEQIVGPVTEIEARSDVWSVGALAYHLLSGRHANDGQTPREMLLLGASSAPPPLASFVPCVGIALARVIDRALCIEKRDRWASARDMQLALAEAYRETFGTDLARQRGRDVVRPAPHHARPQNPRSASTLRSRVDSLPSPSKTLASTLPSARTATEPATLPMDRRRQAIVAAAGMALALQGTALVSTSGGAPGLLSLGSLGIAFGVWLIAWMIGSSGRSMRRRSVARRSSIAAPGSRAGSAGYAASTMKPEGTRLVASITSLMSACSNHSEQRRFSGLSQNASICSRTGR